jgi:hypothetical protein
MRPPARALVDVTWTVECYATSVLVLLNVGTIDLNLQRIWPTPRKNCRLCACVKTVCFRSLRKDVATARKLELKAMLAFRTSLEQSVK